MKHGKVWRWIPAVIAFSMCLTGTAMAEETAVQDAPAQTETEEALYIGEDGSLSAEEIYTAQQILSELGYYAYAPDGVYGSVTREAVAAFQAAFGLYVDGEVGPITMQALQNARTQTQASEPAPQTSAPAETADTQTTLSVGSNGDEVVKVQQALAALGYLTAPADGDYGWYTAAAVEDFQRANDLYVDGVAGPYTLGVLFSGNAAAAPGSTSAPGSTASQETSQDPETEEEPENAETPEDAGESLTIGSTGEAVKKVQQALAELGYLTAPVDGDYGQYTAGAVTAFQRANNLYVDGVAGPYTKQVLFSADAVPADSAPEDGEGDDSEVLTIGSTGEKVSKVQQLLSDLGYPDVTVDGDYGQFTANAVKVFQRTNGLSVTGDVDPETARKLESDPKAYDPSEEVSNAVRLARAKLDAVGWDLYAAYRWSAYIPYTSNYTGMTVSSAAEYGFNYAVGDCVAKASTFCLMARELGYDCKVIFGSVPYARGGYGDHAWCEIQYNGGTYVCDPDFEWDDGRNGYMIYYGQSGTWRYIYGYVLGE
ncbi:MAG: peptidoglycan-binding protein [Parasporobacterium sp.]|nr:peptidoglycan-binding protein [Parasporobacterium sp.]